MILQAYAEVSGVGERRCASDAALRVATWSWAFVMMIGQWLYVYYLVATYGRSMLSADDLAFGVHVVCAVVVLFGGMLQLVPQIRRRAIALHRWNGRAFVVVAAAASVDGLYMKWWPHASPDLVNAISVSLDAVLILAFVAVAWRAALARDIERHRRWALRAFMVVNAVFFIRIFTSAWLALANGAGMTDGMTGPMNYFFDFACYLLPLAVLELYLRARASARPITRCATALVLLMAAAYMAAGTVAYTAHKWQHLG